MKIFAILILLIILNSCGNNYSEQELRKEMDRIKLEELPKLDYTVTEFASDTIKNGKLISEINHISRYGNKSISITTKYYLKDSLICKIMNGPFEDSNFEGQKIKSENHNWSLYYLIKNKNKESFLFQLKMIETKLEISKIDSLSANWNKLKSDIIGMK